MHVRGRTRALAGFVAVAVTLSLGLPSPGRAEATGQPERVTGDVALVAEAAELDALIDDHLWYGQIAGTAFATAEQRPGDVVGIFGTGDSGIWTGHYLASQAHRYAVAKASGDVTELAKARARVDAVTTALHRNIWISKSWNPAQTCSTSTLPTLGHGSCGVTTGEPGALFRNCFPEGFPFQQQDPATRHRMIFGPIPWDDGQNWFCEDGTSRDQYAGVVFGLLATLELVGPEDPVLARQIAGDLMIMTDYLVRHGWSVVRPHTTVETEGSENFVFPLFVNVPSARLHMAVAARYAAQVAGTAAEQAQFDAIWAEEWAGQSTGQTVENLLAVQSPHNSYYVFNLAHVTQYDIARFAPDPSEVEAEKAYFAVIDETTRDDLNAHFETLTWTMTGESWRHDLATQHLREWVTYRDNGDDGIVRSTPERCAPAGTAPTGDQISCVPKNEARWYLDTTSGPVGVTQPSYDVEDYQKTVDGEPVEVRSEVPLPVAERVKQHDFLWQRSPYELRTSQPPSPNNREPGVDFLLPYWMLRYHEQVDPPAVAPLPDWAGPHTEATPPGWTGPSEAPAPRPAPGTGGGLEHLVGALHEHSGYSDGWVGTRPEDYFRSAQSYGLDFLGSGEHSDTADVPLTVNDGCLDPALTIECAPGDDDQPTDSAQKWDATLTQARNVSDAGFTAFRGFEWTSDRFGHINVYFSENDTNAKADGGYLAMNTFYEWFGRRPELGGGADGIATFNHPGAKQLVDQDPTQNWNDFTYEAAADDRMVGVEVFNDDEDFGSRGPAEGWYAHALDKGWHLGAVGAEDLGHRQDDAEGADADNWGGPVWPKTVIIAPDRSPASLRAAMLARRFYAVRTNDGLRLDFTVDGAPMGSRLTRSPGSALLFEASVNQPNLTLELVTSGNRVVASSSSTDLALGWPASAEEPWYFLRVRRADGEPVAYSSPVWVAATGGVGVAGEWLAGDLHVHTCYSHDAYCGPDDENSPAADVENGDYNFYTLSGDVDERFTEAAVRGLDYLAVTDHSDVRSVTDPGFGAHGVLPIPGYENSLSGHAQMLGARTLYPHGDGAAAISSLAAALRADGGVFQINHPADGVTEPLASCSAEELSRLDWGYGTQVVPDTIEVWNIGHQLQPPAPAGNSNDDSERFWECFLDAGYHVGATGGSDTHWLSTNAVQGVGNPTTWVFANDRSEAGVLRALREGRTSVSMLPPLEGGAPLLLEGDADGNGVYEAMVGDSVPPGTPMRVRSASASAVGLVQVRANGETIVDGTPLAPGAAVTFDAPDAEGWVRASLQVLTAPAELDPACDLFTGTPVATSYCRNQLVVAGLTSPVYVERVPSSLVLDVEPVVHATDSTELCALLTSPEGPLAGREVRLSLGSLSVIAQTGAGGAACATVAVDLDPGPAIATASFAGDQRYSPSSANAPVTVVPEPTALTYTGPTHASGTVVVVGARLTERDGVPLAGRTVTFTIPGKSSVSLVTDATGIAAGVLTVISHGKQATVVVTYAGESRRAPTTVSATITWGT